MPSKSLTRRNMLTTGLAAAAGATLSRPAPTLAASSGSYRLRIALAAYSFRKYLGGGADKASMTIGEFIDYCADQGLDGTEPTSYYIYNTDPDYLHGLMARAFRQGIEISGTAIGNNFCLAPGPKLEEELAKCRRWIDAAIHLGAPHIRVFAGRRLRGGSREQDFANMIPAMRRAVDYAAARGVFLGIENHGYLTETADDVLRIIDAVPSPWLGVNLDTGNFKGDGYAEIAKVAPKSINCQVKTEINDDGGKRPVDLPRIFSILRQANYRGYVALEYEGREEPKAAVPRYLEQMKALAAQS